MRLAGAYAMVAFYAAGRAEWRRGLDDILEAVPAKDDLARFKHNVIVGLDVGLAAGVDNLDLSR